MYSRQPRILILTAGYGEGHLQVSRALMQSFKSYHVDDVQILDLMGEAHPILNLVFTKLYQLSSISSQFGFDYYGWAYYITRNNNPQGSVNRYLNALGKRKVLDMIEAFRPDAVINTFPYGVASDKGDERSLPTYTVITDYTLHSRWVHPYTDKYYVATEDLKEALISNQGEAEGKVRVTGIPVRTTFYGASAAPYSSGTENESLKKRVLIMVGAFTVFQHIVELIYSLLENKNCEIVVVCGNKEKVGYKLRALFPDHPDVHVLGYVEQMHELMAASSCIVTKAGGITLSEALVMRLPIFIIKPYGGQERENALYFKHKELAEISNDVRELGEQLRHFLSAPTASGQIRNRMETMYEGEATESIVKDILSTLEQQHNHDIKSQLAGFK